MQILVLDTIHGGKTIGAAFAARGDAVDLVDVYRGTGGTISVHDAQEKSYDLIVSPVHLDPEYPLLMFFSRQGTKIVTHHEAVRMLLDECPSLPGPMIEITGARGKTTTAHALASVMQGPGILHTSSGTYRYPEQHLLGRPGITPASVLGAVDLARETGGWLIAEESLGVTGAGTLAIITSGEDYLFASGKKRAVAEKLRSVANAQQILLAEGVSFPCDHENAAGNVIHLTDIASCYGARCTIYLTDRDAEFSNPLLALSAYRSPLMLAGVAAAMLGCDPSGLASFNALPGRMSAETVGNVLVIDNANSGTNAATTIEAAAYARKVSGMDELTLVIGQAEGDGAVCEGFTADQIRSAIQTIRPAQVVLVGKVIGPVTPDFGQIAVSITPGVATLEEGYSVALDKTRSGSVVLAVKTWR